MEIFEGEITIGNCPAPHLQIFCKCAFNVEIKYCRTHNLRVCLYIAYIACGSALLYIKMLYFFLYFGAPIAYIKIRYDAKTPQFAIFGSHVICVFYSSLIACINAPIVQINDNYYLTTDY